MAVTDTTGEVEPAADGDSAAGGHAVPGTADAAGAATPAAGAGAAGAATPAAGAGAADAEARPAPGYSTGVMLVTSVLTGLCIVFALLLCWKVIASAVDKQPSELMIRLLLSCIGCFVGVAFACLGFGLFLLRAQGAFRATIGTTRALPGTIIESSAPGLIVVVCGTVVLWLSLTVQFTQSTVTRPTPTVEQSSAGVTTSASGSNQAQPLHEQDGVIAP